MHAAKLRMRGNRFWLKLTLPLTCSTRDDKPQTDGSVPSPEVIRAIGRRSEGDENLIEGTDSLVESEWHHTIAGPVGDLNETAGCMIVRSTAAYPLQLMFFRDQILNSVTWAGKPEKEIDQDEFGPRISLILHVPAKSRSC